MHQRKSKKILIYFFLLIIISSINNISLNNLRFQKLLNVEVSGLSDKENKVILDQIKDFKFKNIFLIDKVEINNLINSNSLVETYQIFKKYPSDIKIIIKKTKFLAKINYNDEIFVIGSNGKLILNNFQTTNLPFIFGKPEIKEFLNFKNIIDESKFNFEQIESLYFFPSKRWDIKLKNNVLLKLSNNLTIVSLDYVYDFLKDKKITKFTTIDSRINNQIILNE